MVFRKPPHGYLTKRPYMANIPYVDVDYCQFADWGYQKPTRIWGDESIKDLTSKCCDMETCPNVIIRPNGRKGHPEKLGGPEMRASRNLTFRDPKT